MTVPPALQWIEALQGTTSLDVRLGLSVAVVAIAVVLGKLVVPAVVDQLGRWVERSIGRDGLGEFVETVSEFVPWWVSGRIAVWAFQIVILGATAIGLLVLWDQLTVAMDVLGFVSLSMPVLVQMGLTVLLFIAAYVSVQLLQAWLEGVTEHSENFTKHQEEIAYRVLQLTVFTAVAMGALTVWGIDLSGLIVGAGFLGIVVGMAARQTLGSLIAGFVLMFSRPFEIGDWVEIGDQEGIVTEISIVNTRLENFDGEFVVLPNDIVSNSTIVNRSKKGRIRIRVDVGIDYEADPERAQEVAVEALKDLDDILSVPRPQAVTKQLGDSAVVVEVRFWIDKPSARRRARATSAVIRAIKDAFDEADIKIPFPQRELLGREEAGGFTVQTAGTGGDD